MAVALLAGSFLAATSAAHAPPGFFFMRETGATGHAPPSVVKWLVRFHEPPAPQRRRQLEQQLSCVFIEIVDGRWLVLAGSDFDSELRSHDAAVSSVDRQPPAAAIQMRLLQQLQRRSDRRRSNWNGRHNDVHVLRVQSVAAIRTLSLPHRPRPLHTTFGPSPSHCRIHAFELDRPGHLSLSVTGTWTCVLHAISSLISHPTVVSVDLLPHLLLHNRNSSLLLANAENTASLANDDLSWLPALGLDGSGELIALHPYPPTLTHGAGEVIALADSGIDWDHCAFSPDLPLPLNTFNISKKKIIAYFSAGMPSAGDFTRACTQRCGSGDASDDLEGHGTHVAGTAAGRAPASSSYSSYNSMAAAARIVFTDIQVSSDSLTIPDDLYSGIFADAYAAGARIHSNSWGCGRAPGDPVTRCNVYDAMAADIDRFAWEHEDFVVLVAAGNDGTSGAGTVSTPATCKNCITVGSSEGFYESGVSYEYKPPASWTAPHPNNMAEFSSYGSTLPDGRTKPDVVALGLSVRSAASNGFISSAGNCGHSKKSGTSMSTPAVASLVALIRQHFRTSYPAPPLHRSSQHLVGKPSAALLRSALINIARPLSGRYFDGNKKSWRALPLQSCGSSTIVTSPWLNVFTPGSSSCNATMKVADSMQGYGRPYLSNLINRPGSSEAAAHRQLFVMDVSNSEGLASQHYISVSLQLSAAASPARAMSVSLAWTDYQGSLLSQKALVNDLDLIVSVGKRNSGSVTVYRGGGGNMPDTINNAEKVLLAGLAAAEDVVTVNVSAWSVSSGRQGFALVIVGYFHPSSVSVTSPSDMLPSQKWNPDHNFLRLYLNVSYVLLTNDFTALQLLHSKVQSSVATLVRCDPACVRLSSIVRDQRLRSSTGCSVDIFFNPCATDAHSSAERPFQMLLSGYNDPLSLFYQLDGLASATALMTPEEAASVRTVDDSKQTETDLTVAVVVLAILVVLLLVAGSVYFTLRLMKPKAKIAPAAAEPQLQNFDPEAQPAGDERSGEMPDGANESEREGRGGAGGASFTMDMWASEAAISSEAEALEEALHSQISQVQTLPRAHLMCSDAPQGALESILWGYEGGGGPRSLPGAIGTSDALPILASRPQLDRFLSSARALDLLRPMRDSLRRAGGAADYALPQWGTGLPGEVRVLQMQGGGDDGAFEGGEDGDGRESEKGVPEDEAVGWGY